MRLSRIYGDDSGYWRLIALTSQYNGIINKVTISPIYQEIYPITIHRTSHPMHQHRHQQSNQAVIPDDDDDHTPKRTWLCVCEGTMPPVSSLSMLCFGCFAVLEIV